MRKTVLAAIGMAIGFGLPLTHADTLQMTGVSADRAGVSIPPRGTTMAQVESRYGAPAERLSAVGQPPITRWVYPTFVVYFEYNLVIHAVATPGSAPDTGSGQPAEATTNS
jgi:hypothetical protein